MKPLNTTLALLTAMATIHCSGASLVPDNNPIENKKSIRPLKLTYQNSCDDLKNSFRTQLLSQLETQYQAFQECRSLYYEDDAIMSPTTSDSANSEISTGSVRTTTNIQVEGVDEADIVKTNGAQTFVIQGNGVDILEHQGSIIKKVARIDLENLKIKNLYLDAEKLFVVSQTPWDQKSKTSVQVLEYDVATPQNPILKNSFLQQGDLLQSRKISDRLHLAIRSEINIPDDIQRLTWLAEVQNDYYDACTYSSDYKISDAIKNKITQAYQAAKIQIENLSIEDAWFPTSRMNDQKQEIDCKGFATQEGQTKSQNQMELTSLVSIESNSNAVKMQSSHIPMSGWHSNVYASKTNFYIVNSIWGTSAELQDQTQIHMFNLQQKDKLHAYKNSAAVEGFVLNSFSMDEFEGTFRIATTTSATSEQDSQSHVSVLSTDDDDFKIIGSVSGLGKNESIFSVRFLDKRAFVVTFKKIDPFYVIDLEDPTNPKVTGELKIPGFSNYLHILDDDHVIGLGKDADDQGSFAWFGGMKISLFDVSENTNPEEQDQIVIGGRGTDSEALYDHHAFSFDRQSGELFLPVTLYQSTTGGSRYGSFIHNGLHVYKIEPETGITSLQEIVIADAESDFETVRRSFVTESDTQKLLYVITNKNVIVYEENDGTYNMQHSEPLTDNYNVYGCFDFSDSCAF